MPRCVHLPKIYLGFDTRFYDGSREIHKTRKLHTVILEPDLPTRDPGVAHGTALPLQSAEARADHSHAEDTTQRRAAAPETKNWRWPEVDGQPRIYAVSLGASTPLGRGAWASAAAVRAGICGFAQHPYMIDAAGEPMRVAFAPWIDIGVRASIDSRRYCFRQWTRHWRHLKRYRHEAKYRRCTWAACPTTRIAEGFADELVSRVHAAIPGVFRGVAAFPIGHSAGLIALQAAFKRLSQARLDACLVAGVDC